MTAHRLFVSIDSNDRDHAEQGRGTSIYGGLQGACTIDQDAHDLELTARTDTANRQDNQTDIP